MINGCSTGWLPTHVKMNRLAASVQNRSWEAGRKAMVRCLDLWRRGLRNRISTEAARARTPPSLLGIDRRIAYANRKYHSGLMCGGVVRGFAGVKFSGSPSKLGENRARVVSERSMIANPSRSFREKYGWNGILSQFDGMPRGLFDPDSWRKVRWMITRLVIMNGRRKCRAKNRVKVGLSTENPPQAHSTSVCPMYGMAENRFVITVAPQNDIWPHGKT